MTVRLPDVRWQPGHGWTHGHGACRKGCRPPLRSDGVYVVGRLAGWWSADPVGWDAR